MGLYQNLRRDTVSRLPLREAIRLAPSTKVRSAIDHIRSKGLGCAIVVDRAGQPLGVFTEHCIVRLLLRSPEAIDQGRVEQHLDKNWACVRETDSVMAVVTAMRTHQVQFVVVTNAAGQAIALTGQKGVMEYVAEHFPRIIVQHTGSVALPHSA